MPDSVEITLLPRLLAHLEAEAPKVRVLVRSTDRFDVLEQLDRDRLHLGVGRFTEGAVHHKRRRLFGGNYLCLYDPARLPLATPLTLEDYLAVPHVLGSPRGDAHGVVDDALAPLGLRRTIAVTTPHFAAVPFILKGARLLATVPQRPARIFAERFGLATSPVPLALPDFDVSMLWHASYDHDPRTGGCAGSSPPGRRALRRKPAAGARTPDESRARPGRRCHGEASRASAAPVATVHGPPGFRDGSGRMTGCACLATREGVPGLASRGSRRTRGTGPASGRFQGERDALAAADAQGHDAAA